MGAETRISLGDRNAFLPILEMLVAAGADVDFRDEETRRSPFWAAVYPPIVPPSVVYFLLAHGLRVENLSSCDEIPIRAVAGDGGELRLVEAIVAAGAKVNVTGTRRPLHMALRIDLSQSSFLMLAQIHMQKTNKEEHHYTWLVRMHVSMYWPC